MFQPSFSFNQDNNKQQYHTIGTQQSDIQQIKEDIKQIKSQISQILEILKNNQNNQKNVQQNQTPAFNFGKQNNQFQVNQVNKIQDNNQLKIQFPFGATNFTQQTVVQPKKLQNFNEKTIEKFNQIKTYSKCILTQEQIQQKYDQISQKLNKQLIQLDAENQYRKYFKISEYSNISSTFNNNDKKQTVAMWLASQGIVPDQKWIHQSDLQDFEGNTVAMLLSMNKIVPQQQWYHQKFLKNNSKQTVKSILNEKNILEIPKEFDYKDPQRIDRNENTQAMIQAYQGKIPDKELEHDPTLKNKQDLTVAMILIQKGINPPQQWYYMASIKILKDSLYNQWQYLTFSEYMMNQQLIPSEYYVKNDRKIANISSSQLYNKKIPIPSYLCQNSFDKFDKYNEEVLNCIFNNEMDKINYQNFDPSYQNANRQTAAMLIAKLYHRIPEKQFNHPYQLTNSYGETVAQILACQGIIPPKQWSSNCVIQQKNQQSGMIFTFESMKQNENDETIAMILAKQGIIPSSDWLHDPELKNKKGETVAILLAQSGIIPPKEWMHNIRYFDLYGKSILSLLINHGYKYENDQFIQDI